MSTLGNFCIEKLFVHFWRFLHLAHVGFSSPSNTSSCVNHSKQSRSDVSELNDRFLMGRERSKKGSNVLET